MKGWKVVQTINDKGVTIKSNGQLALITIIKTGVTCNAWTTFTTFNSSYTPEHGIRFAKNFADSELDNTHLYITGNTINSPGALSNKSLDTSVMYKLKNPLY